MGKDFRIPQKSSANLCWQRMAVDIHTGSCTKRFDHAGDEKEGNHFRNSLSSC